MSWATCYSGSNNIHFNYPPLMADGRSYASWQPDAVINRRIQKDGFSHLFISEFGLGELLSRYNSATAEAFEC